MINNFNRWLFESFRISRRTLKVDIEPDLLLEDRPANLHHYVEGWLYVFSVKVLEDYFFDNFLKPGSVARLGYAPLLNRRLVRLLIKSCFLDVGNLSWFYLELESSVSYLYVPEFGNKKSLFSCELADFLILVSKKQPRWFGRERFGWASYPLRRHWVRLDTIVVDRWFTLTSGGGSRGIFYFLIYYPIWDLIRFLYPRRCWLPNFLFLNARYNRIRFGRYFIFPSRVRSKWYFLNKPGSRKVTLLQSEYVSRFIVGGSDVKIMALGGLGVGVVRKLAGFKGSKGSTLFTRKAVKRFWSRVGGRCVFGSEHQKRSIVGRSREVFLLQRYVYLKKNSAIFIASAGSIVGDVFSSNFNKDHCNFSVGSSLGDWGVVLGVLKRLNRFEDACLTLEDLECSAIYSLWKKVGGIDRFEGWAEGQKFFGGSDIYSNFIHKTDTSIMSQLLLNCSGVSPRFFK